MRCIAPTQPNLADTTRSSRRHGLGRRTVEAPEMNDPGRPRSLLAGRSSRRPMSSRLPARVWTARRVELSGISPCVTWITRSPRPRSCAASSLPTLGRPAAPSSTNSNQLAALPMRAAPMGHGQVRTLRKYHRVLGLLRLGRVADANGGTNPASCSSNFHLSGGRQGWSGRRS